MKNQSIQDERVISQKRKIGSDALGMVYIGLLISILIQQFMFEAPFSQYAAEFILFMLLAFYVVIRNIMVGNSLFDSNLNGQKVVLLGSLFSGLTITVITITFNIINYGMTKMGGLNGIALTGVITFAFSVLASFIGFKFLYLINKKRQKQLDDKYVDTDE